MKAVKYRGRGSFFSSFDGVEQGIWAIPVGKVRYRALEGCPRMIDSLFVVVMNSLASAFGK